MRRSPRGRRSRTVVRLAAALFAVYVLWGSNYVAIKLGLETVPAFPLLTIRCGLAGALLFAFAAPRGNRAADPLGPRQWLATLLLALLLLGAGNGAVFFAEQYVSSGLAALLAGTMPIWAALLAAVIDRRGIPLLAVTGLALGMVGLVVLLDPHGGPNGTAFAIGIALGGAALFGLGSVLAPRLPVPKRPLVSAAMQMLWASIFFAIVAALGGQWPASLGVITHPWSPGFIATFLWLVFCAGLLAFVAYLWLLNNVSLLLANSYAFVNPAIAVALGVIILGEPLTLRVVAGTTVVVAAVTLTVLAPRPRIEETP
jgi:drug/metabolite transporter (DMT)-like permease